MTEEPLKIRPEIRPTLIDIKKGDTVNFPIAGLKSVMSQASEFGAILDIKFVTKTNRVERTIEVNRIS